MASFFVGLVSIWIHLEIRIAEINVDLTSLKQDMIVHKADNRKDFELNRTDIGSDTKRS
ncbi:MAG: hypothetical protein M0Q38_05775 [Bacteroidales bacterium]|nr:hypothetical protein [Bacteroidales bacterium]